MTSAKSQSSTRTSSAALGTTTPTVSPSPTGRSAPIMSLAALNRRGRMASLHKLQDQGRDSAFVLNSAIDEFLQEIGGPTSLDDVLTRNVGLFGERDESHFNPLHPNQ